MRIAHTVLLPAMRLLLQHSLAFVARTIRAPAFCVLLAAMVVTPTAAAQEVEFSDVTDQANTRPRLEVDTPIAREGYFVLTWESGDRSALMLQRSTSERFDDASAVPVVSSGSLTVTGLRDGEYRFRVGDDGNWSEVQRVRVEHHSLSTALLWFAVGALLFAVLAAVILSGNARIDRKERQS